ncbi:hypothetical protein LI328DRAFT_159923 [Trichoderma asperelloides]|nr:hypothetical protein LI328DRAFT_159923 [Trichoderma asperelloides]
MQVKLLVSARWVCCQEATGDSLPANENSEESKVSDAGEGGGEKGLSTREKYKFGGWWRVLGLHKSTPPASVKIRRAGVVSIWCDLGTEPWSPLSRLLSASLPHCLSASLPLCHPLPTQPRPGLAAGPGFRPSPPCASAAMGNAASLTAHRACDKDQVSQACGEQWLIRASLLAAGAARLRALEAGMAETDGQHLKAQAVWRL